MVTNNFLVCALILSIFLLSTEGASIYGDNLSKNNQILYRRYIRRRPPMQHNDQYFDEVVEIFHTKHRPPTTVNIMTDEDVDKFIFCDFNRELEECKIYWESRKPKKPTKPTTTQKPKVELTTKIPMKTTTKTPVVVETTTAKVAVTTTATITSTTKEITTDLPRLPDIIEEYDYDDQKTLKQDVENVYDTEYNDSENDEAEATTAATTDLPRIPDITQEFDYDDQNTSKQDEENVYEDTNNENDDVDEDEDEDNIDDEKEDKTENDYENNYENNEIFS